MDKTLVPHLCDCKSGRRTLVLFAKNFAERFPELLSFGAKENWFYFPEYGIVQIEVGTGKQWSGAAEVVNFLRGVITNNARLAELKAAWLDPKQLLTEQLVNLVTEAEPISSFAPAESSQLLDILTAGRIETWFQPVVEARGGTVWGYECLMRGRTADGALVGAPQMLEWARAENLTFMLDRVCRETHLENAGKLDFKGKCHFLINFLPTAIYQPEFCLQSSLAAARRAELKPEQIIFEVVETEKIEDREHLKRILDFYRRSGFNVALDDMGSGYAGLAMLADLQPDLVKIDREIVSKAVESKAHRSVCVSLVQIARDNDQMILAEGVETEAETELMKSLGVDLLQGYFYGKPAPQPALLPQTEHFRSENLLPEFA